MLPDARTLNVLLVLAEEFTSDDGLITIERMDEDGVDYWEMPYAAACWSCKRVRDDAINTGLPIRGLSVADVPAIDCWRPVRDGAEALRFLQEHHACGDNP